MQALPNQSCRCAHMLHFHLFLLKYVALKTIESQRVGMGN